MAIITLTTDLGLRDYYVSAVKGAILSQLPDVMIVDISHEIQAFDIFQASYTLKNSYIHFPVGSIHIIGINAQPDFNAPYLGVYANGHYFFGADNGFFSLMLDRKPDKIVELNLKQDVDYLTFPTRDVFAKAACHIARGGTLEVIGTAREGFTERTHFRPIVESNLIRGTVIYIDSYQNIISNITQSLIRETGKDRPFVITISRYNIDTISKSYNEVAEGEIVALFNSAGHLELAMNKGSMATLLNIQLGDIITVRFQ